MSRPRAARRSARNTARFWVYHNDGWARLALAWGESAELHSGGPHEEGFHWTTELYTNTGDRVTCDTTESWHDCDGPGDRFCASFCLLAELQAREADEMLQAPGGLPVWRVEQQTRRDHFAEAMGY